MLRLVLFLVICLTAASPRAIAGAWETGPLDNDTALDFLNEATVSSDVVLLRQVFSAAVADPNRLLDDEVASRALAAAELVAAMLGAAAPALPDTALAWAKRQAKAADRDLVQLAIRALDRIAANSETRTLWQDNGEKDLGAWLAGLTELKSRLRPAAPTP